MFLIIHQLTSTHFDVNSIGFQPLKLELFLCVSNFATSFYHIIWLNDIVFYYVFLFFICWSKDKPSEFRLLFDSEFFKLSSDFVLDFIETSSLTGF